MRLPHTLRIKRLTEAEDGSGHTWVLQDGTEPCFIQSLSPARAQQMNMAYGQAFKCYVRPASTLEVGDYVIDQDGGEYKVSDFEPRNYGTARSQHKLFTITKDTEDRTDA